MFSIILLAFILCIIIGSVLDFWFVAGILLAFILGIIIGGVLAFRFVADAMDKAAQKDDAKIKQECEALQKKIKKYEKRLKELEREEIKSKEKTRRKR